MKSLSLYVDKWYIVGAVCTDNITRPITLPNREDRIWLYFFEDVANDAISYGSGFKKQYYNNENHYYSDVFSLILDRNATFTMFKRPQSIVGIFKAAKIFDDLRKNMAEEGDIDTYLSFSADISPAARKLLIDEFNKENFVIKESVARIEQLALEYSVMKNRITDNGYYLVLNACNENLHYSVYLKTEKLFVRKNENKLLGLGTDARNRSLVEYIVDTINDNTHLLKSSEEKECEYLRMTQFADGWIAELSNANGQVPVQLINITFSKDPYKAYSITVIKNDIDDRTKAIVKDIVDNIVEFARAADVESNQIKGVVLLGSSFTNSQFHDNLFSHYSIQDDHYITYRDSELSSLVSAYSFIDCSQFSTASDAFSKNAEAELLRIKNAKEEEDAKQKAEAAEAAANEDAQRAAEEQRKYKDAVDQGLKSEQDHDYADMVDYFKIALELQPTDAMAKQKYDEALQLKANADVLSKQYKDKIKQAQTSFKAMDWEGAKQKADEALGCDPKSAEAKRIKNESERNIAIKKELIRHIDRADLFIAQKSYTEARQEIGKAKLLDANDKDVKEREEKITTEEQQFDSKITTLSVALAAALSTKNFHEALKYCKDLIDTDIANVKKWTAYEEKIKSDEKEDETWSDLNKKAHDAYFNEKWEYVIGYIKSALYIRDDAELQKLLQKAQAKLNQAHAENLYKQAINEVKADITDGKLENAKEKLCNLQKKYPDRKEEFKSLFTQIFNAENKADKHRNSTAKSDSDADKNDKRAHIGGFGKEIGKTAPKKPATKSADPDPFEFDAPIKKVASRPVAKEMPPHQSNEDFFTKNSFVSKSKPDRKKGDDFFDMDFPKVNSASQSPSPNNTGTIEKDKDIGKDNFFA